MCALVTGVQTCALPISCADVAREPVYPLKLWIILWMEGGCPPPLQTRRARYRSVQKPHNGERYLLPSDSDVPCSACAGSLLPSSSSSISAMRSEEHTSETPVTNAHLVCRLLLEKKKKTHREYIHFIIYQNKH